MTVIPIIVGAKELGKETKGAGYPRKIWDHLDFRTVEICWEYWQESTEICSH